MDHFGSPLRTPFDHLEALDACALIPIPIFPIASRRHRPHLKKNFSELLLRYLPNRQHPGRILNLSETAKDPQRFESWTSISLPE